MTLGKAKTELAYGVSNMEVLLGSPVGVVDVAEDRPPGGVADLVDDGRRGSGHGEPKSQHQQTLLHAHGRHCAALPAARSLLSSKSYHTTLTYSLVNEAIYRKQEDS